jgi:adenosine deaminase
MVFVRVSATLVVVTLAACGTPGHGGDDTTPDGSLPACAGTPSECAAKWEQNAADRFDVVLTNPTELATFLKAVPKGGDLHNHLTGAVYAETYLGWAKTDGDCINTSSLSAVYSNQCTTGTQAVPTSGSFYDQIVHAWSMKDFAAGAQTGHDHFFATFGKYGAIAGAHRDDDLADVATRAAEENQLYVETMFNLGKNVGTLAASVWSTPVTAADLPAFYDALIASPTFAAQLASDVAVVTDAGTRYRTTLGCSDLSPPAACDVGVRFIAQVSRTGANDQIFGQLVSAYEMAARTPQIVGANLSSPEDDATSLANYDLHMAMLDFLYTKYTTTHRSPLHVTLHAGEVVPKFLPPNSTDNTFHVRHAVETAHAERIGHGVDVMSETDPDGLLDEMRDRNVLVEVCLSSNDQILEVRGAAHPLAQYLAHEVPVALATDDQGVSRSSMAGEYTRAALDQHLDYRQLKTIARNSLEHAFLPGASLWVSVAHGQPVADCVATDTMGIGGAPNTTCAAFLASSERAAIQWELEKRFLAFESAQPAKTP